MSAYFNKITNFFKINQVAIIKILLPILLVAAIYKICDKTQQNTVLGIRDIFSISDAVREAYIKKPDYWGLDTNSAIDNNIIPVTFTKNDKIILSNGERIMIGQGKNAETIMPLVQTFDIVMQNINKAQCVAFSEADLSDDDLIKLEKFTIINKNGNYVFEWGGTHSLPIKKYQAKNFCIDNNNALIWTLK